MKLLFIGATGIVTAAIYASAFSLLPSTIEREAGAASAQLDQQLAVLQANMSDLETSANEKQSELSALTTQRDQLAADNAELQTRADTMTTELAEMSDVLGEDTINVEALAMRMSAFDQRQAELDEAVSERNSLLEANEYLTSRDANMRQEASALTEELEAARFEVTTLTSRIERLEQAQTASAEARAEESDGLLAEKEALTQELDAARGEVTTLSARVSELEQAQTATLEASAEESDGLLAEKEALTQELDAARGEVVTLSARVSELEQAQTATLEASAEESDGLLAEKEALTQELDAARGEVVTLSARVTELEQQQVDLADSTVNGELLAAKNNDLSSQNASLNEQLATLSSDYDFSRLEMVTLRARIDALNEALTEATSQQGADVQDLQAQLSSSEEALETANARIELLQTEADSVAQLSEESSKDRQALEDATAEIAAYQAALDEMNVALSAAETEAKTLRTANAAELAAIEEQAGTANDALAEANATIASLSEATGDITALEGQVEATYAALTHANGEIRRLQIENSELAELQSEAGDGDQALIEATQRIEALTEENATLAALQGEVDTANEALAAANEEIQSLSRTSSAQLDVLEQLRGQVAFLQAARGTARNPNTRPVILENATTTSVQTSETGFTVETCTEQTNLSLAGGNILFETGTATLVAASVELLETLSETFLGCAEDDLLVEIGGHTDNLGSDVNNLVLSEERALSVQQFLIGQGVPVAAMRPVGFGESQPIAENTTSDGRSANRRITFAWQTR